MADHGSKKESGQKRWARMIPAPASFFRYSMAQFLVGLVVLLIGYPFIVELEHGQLLEDVLMTIILISAVLAVGGRAWVLTIFLAVPALAGPWFDLYLRGAVPFWVLSAARMLFVGFVASQLLRFILRSTTVNSEVLCAGISSYLMLGLLWTAAFRMISERNPDSFSGLRIVAHQPMDRFDALYLSFSSLTCVGCNDITPSSKVARMLLMLEATTGVLFVAVLIARLVALYTHSVTKNHGQEPPAANS